MIRYALPAAVLFGVLAPLPAAAADETELWCMPSRICRGEVCTPTTDTESSIRLHHRDGAAPMLRADAEDVPMTRTHSGEVQQWQGETGYGSTVVLAWRPADGSYIYKQRAPDGTVFTDTGLCEVQS